MSVKLKGADQLKSNLEKLANQSALNYRKALHVFLLSVWANAVSRTPKKSGFLRGSSGAKVTKANSVGAEGVVYYTANYAKFVHAGVRNGIPLKFKVGEAKFLEKAIKELAPVMAQALGISLKGSMFR